MTTTTIGGVDIQTTEESMTEIIPYEDTNDPSVRTHIVDFLRNKQMDEMYSSCSTAQDVVDMARMFGSEVLALCGYKWIPVHNPQKFPECKKCFDIMRSMT